MPKTLTVDPVFGAAKLNSVSKSNVLTLLCTAFLTLPCISSLHAQQIQANNSTATPTVTESTVTTTDELFLVPVVQSAQDVGIQKQVDSGSVPATTKANHSDKKDAVAELPKKINESHKGVFFQNDFSYLTDAAYTENHFGDQLKLRSLPSGGWYDIGGQYRLRLHSENNIRGLGLTGNDDNFLLQRTRVYGDFHFSDRLRVYSEFIDAESNYENFAPRSIDVNRADMLNLFFDYQFAAAANGPVTVRVGRQELMFGSQRVVSPLDWGNTRRTFEGFRLTQKRGDWTLDGFWTNPVRVNPHRFDSPNRDEEFMGVYASNAVTKTVTSDVYFLRYLNGTGSNHFETNTLGWRNQGSQNDFLWDAELNYQFGENTDGSDKSAGAATLGLGRKLSDRKGSPTFWAFYDYASGDSQNGNGFNHQFPLAHKYLGLMDLYGRNNIEDVNFLLTVSPSDKLQLLAWYHFFSLATQADSPYSVAMTPFNGANPAGSTDLGHEIDFTATYKISARQEWVLGYSHFFSGDYYTSTPGISFAGDANFYYAQWAINF